MLGSANQLALRRRLRAFRDKNEDEIGAFLSRRMPAFITSRRSGNGPLVLVFHEVDADTFETQLQYLRNNHYETLGVDDACQCLRRGRWPSRSVLLTFDDATANFWVIALPLLRRYGMRAVLFAIPGLVPPGITVRKTLEDLWSGNASAAELRQAAADEPLCNWPELQACARSGLVEIQSHSLTHSRIPVSAAVIDIQSPDFPVGNYANADLPLSSFDTGDIPERQLRLGAPVFSYASRLADPKRFLLNREREQVMLDFVADRGGSDFFHAANWQQSWLREFGRDQSQHGRFETQQEQHMAIERELAGSRDLLQANLPGVLVRHFCLPWFHCGRIAAKVAAACGYESLWFGVDIDIVPPPGLLCIPRYSEHYCHRLPGMGRSTLLDVWLRRVRNMKGS